MNKCCGNCKHFKYEDAIGIGVCNILNIITQCDTSCSEYSSKFNGWTEITPDNVDEIDSDINYLVIATIEGGEVVCNMYNDWYLGLSSMAKYGGYYYYVLPELKIE